MNEIRDQHFTDGLVQYGREYLLTDVNDLVWKWLKQSHFVDSKNQITNRGKSLLLMLN
ncbi:hypothetical protein N9L70_02865 [Rhodobacteraceae bacterium]|nr:hypothetical protein [Paracoccaceae bacterium]